MTVPAAHWQLDRLSTAARKAAAKAAVGAGVSLSFWLATLIDDTCCAEGVPSSPEPSKILQFARDSRDPSLPLQPITYRATPLVVAPVSAYRPLRMPLKVPEAKS